MSNYAYIRVSTKEQNEDRQLIALQGIDIPEKNIIVEKKSGKDFARPKYQKMIRKMKKGDLLYVKSIDRLGRNYTEIIEQWRFLTKKKGVNIIVIDMPLLDTTKDNDLTGILISDIVLQLLSYVAETERQFIKARQAEGIAAAKARGVRFGRLPKPLPDNFQEIRERWRKHELSISNAAEMCNMPRSTFAAQVLKYERTVIGK